MINAYNNFYLPMLVKSFKPIFLIQENLRRSNLTPKSNILHMGGGGDRIDYGKGFLTVNVFAIPSTQASFLCFHHSLNPKISHYKTV
jgi:hypothetical protein